MTEKEFYKIIYRRMGALTPIRADCGQLCSRACCEGDCDGDGMYLFPGEEKMYGDNLSWAKISKTNFEYADGAFAPLFACNGFCDRRERPLACRIFPLTPYMDRDGVLRVIVDPRGRGMCPMAVLRLSDFEREFTEAVEAIGKIMIKNPRCRAFIESFSRMIDETFFNGV